MILKVLKFQSAEELVTFETDFKEFQEAKNAKKVEHRGSKTKELHKKVKLYLETHNDVKYKAALKIVGKSIKDSKQKKQE